MEHKEGGDPIKTNNWLQEKGYKKKILLDEKDLNASNTILQINIVEPKTNLKPHYHQKMNEAVYILSGEASIIISDKEFPLKPGDLITIKPNQIHTVKNPGEKEFRYLVFKTNFFPDDTYDSN